MQQQRAAYRVLEGDTIVPVGSEAELATIERSFADVAAAEFHGARAHLRKASEELTARRCADSIRESIHAVESVAKALEPSADLSKAVAVLEKSASKHLANKQIKSDSDSVNLGSNPGSPASQCGLCGVISGCVKTADIPAGSGPPETQLTAKICPLLLVGRIIHTAQQERPHD